MDEIGVHSRLNVKKPIVSGIGTTSPVQTVAGKDKSNPLKVVTLPKSESVEEISLKTRRKLPQTLTGSTSRARSRKTKKKPQQNIEQIIKDTLENIFKEQIRPKMEDKHENPEALARILQRDTTKNKEITQDKQVTPPAQLPDDSLEQNQNSDNGNGEHVSDTDFHNTNDAQDPNDYDSGMSFDSIALHNLDT
ncbi:hypothetical protein RND71_003090 [Anisodus tanguticus]|uniref:Uncharacterized protein n=1 Tax=Anisodus tanguticus TaxID=243964 RepID=A0AAE1VWF8_9SOLA|nr:hypothetical protein RND71_003090 [Anisodus tanguticus]